MKKSKNVTLLLCIFLGYLGIHHLYVGRYKMFLLYLFTGGLFAIGWILDIILIVSNKFKDSNGNIITSSLPSSHVPSNYIQNQVSTNSVPNQVKPIQPKSISIPEVVNGEHLKYSYESVELYVVENNKPNFAQLSLGSSIDFIPEPTNEYDSKAIMVYTNGIKLGYLNKGTLQDMVNDYLNKSLPIVSHLTYLDNETTSIKVFIGFYKGNPYKELLANPNSYKKFKLTGNTNSDMQDNIYCLPDNPVGFKLDISYDFEKEKYLVYDIGYIPKNMEEYLFDDNTNKIFVDEVTENDNDKFVVTVIMEI